MSDKVLLPTITLLHRVYDMPDWYGHGCESSPVKGHLVIKSPMGIPFYFDDAYDEWRPLSEIDYQLPDLVTT